MFKNLLSTLTVVGLNKLPAAVDRMRSSFCESEALVDHELFERVQVRWYQRTDGFVIVIEDLLPLALGAHRAGGPDQAGVGSAVTLVETIFTAL